MGTNLEKAILINFTKSTRKPLYRSLFFEKVVGLKFKKKSRGLPLGGLLLLNTLYLLRQPQKVTLDLGYSLMINYKHFQSKYCESLRVRINKIKFDKLAYSS